MLQTGATIAVASEDDDAKKKLEEAQKNFGVTEKGDNGFGQSLEKAKTDNNENSYGYVLNRIITPRYMGRTPKSAVDGQYKGDKVNNCKYDDPQNGTVMYHNCDIPNLTAELYQKLYDIFVPSGVTNATRESSVIENRWFGLPTQIPGNNAPADPGSRQEKYTGLELFGYNLKYTTYAGEYDSIRVDTQARMMANFGLSESFALGAQTIINGIAGGFERAGQRTSEEWNKGNYVGALFAGIGGFFEGGAAASINTILDTSDANVFATRGWSRVGFGKTVYGARELSDSEREAEMLRIMTAMFAQVSVATGDLPEEFVKVKDPPDRPKEGNEKETIKEWKEKNKEFFETAEKIGIKCEVDEDESKREKTIADFYSCYPNKYKEVVAAETQKADDKSIENLIKDATKAQIVQAAIKDVGGLNNPARSYVCLDSQGKDMMTADKTTKVFNDDGSYSGACGPIRAPIQNGIYGNGYDNPVPVDTRRAAYDESITRVFFDASAGSNAIANFSLGISGLATRVSNMFLNLSFSPVLETFGVDKIIVTILTGLRESLFFPLAGLIGMLGVFYYFVTMFRSPLLGLGRVLLIIGILIFGTMLLMRPEQVIHIVDSLPSTIASSLAGALVGGSSPDSLCQTDEDAHFQFQPTTTEGKIHGVAQGNRMLMCENWRLGLFNPWVYGQWGTGLGDLYAVDHKEDGGETLRNSNTSLVGDAAVQMGGGNTMHNWAVYQLHTMSAGTSTEKDTKGIGVTSSDMYRIVDAQAGINNGQGTDSRFFQNWSNKNWSNRMFVALTAPIASIVLAVTVSSYSISKIVITIVWMFYFTILPIVLLAALAGGRGMMSLREWGLTFAGLVFQGVALTVLLALMMYLIMAVANSTTGYMPVMLGTSIVAGIFMMFRKKIMGYILAGSSIAGSLNYADVRRLGEEYLPPSVKTSYQRTRWGMKSAAAGMIAGLRHDGIRGAMEGARTGYKAGKNNMIFKTNVGVVASTRAAIQSGRSTAAKQVREGGYTQNVQNTMDRVAQHSSNMAAGQPVDDAVRSKETAKGRRQGKKVGALEQQRQNRLDDLKKQYRPGDGDTERLENPDMLSVREDSDQFEETRDEYEAQKEAINSDFLQGVAKVVSEGGKMAPEHQDSIANIAADYDLSASGLLGMSIAELEDMLQELLAAENKDENLIAEVREVIALKKRLNNQT